mmetsp:Transcript_20737/g.69277  ORF Transcript_20737/g.69277 Transcript_20737/m.69277 type:complete len:262 (-) Transcript_20737:359-1144(-)
MLLLLYLLDLLQQPVLQPRLLGCCRAQTVNLVLLGLDFDLPVGVLSQQLGVGADLLLQVLLQLLRLLRQQIVLLVRLLNCLLELLDLRVKPLQLLLALGDRLLLRLHLLPLLLQRRLDLLDLLLQSLLLADFSLHVALALVDLLLQGHDVCLVSLFLCVQSPALLLQVHDLVPRRHELLRQVVSFCCQLVLLLCKLVHSVLLPQRQPSPLLHEPAEVGDLELELLDGFLRSLLLLMGGINHLPGLLNLLLERGDRVLILLR